MIYKPARFPYFKHKLRPRSRRRHHFDAKHRAIRLSASQGTRATWTDPHHLPRDYTDRLTMCLSLQNRHHNRRAYPARARCDPGPVKLGRLLAAAGHISASDAALDGPLLCHAVRRQRRDAKVRLQDPAQRPPHDPPHQRQARRRQARHHEPHRRRRLAASGHER